MFRASPKRRHGPTKEPSPEKAVVTPFFGSLLIKATKGLDRAVISGEASIYVRL